MWLHPRGARDVAAALGVAMLVAGCSGSDPDDVEAAQATPEPTIEAPPDTETSPEPTDEPPASEEPEPETTIGENEPLYAPLPELTPDPENDVPDDIEQLILDAYADAYNTAYGAYATGEWNEDDVVRTHFGEALETARATFENLTENNAVDRSGDTVVDSVWITDFEGGSAIVRQCFETGGRTGMYDRETGELLQAAPEGRFARDRIVELVRLPDEDAPVYRVTESTAAGTELCP